MNSTPPNATREKPGKFGLGVVLGSVLMALFWLASVYGQLGAPTGSSEVPYQLILQKSKAVEVAKGPRVLLFGGSSTRYSFKARVLTEELKRPTINFGITAGLQVRYMLEQARKVAKSGDTVVLIPEYSIYEDELHWSMMDYVLSHDPAYFKALPMPEQLKWAGSIPFRRLFNGLVSRVKPGWDFKLYKPDKIDEYGDEENHPAKDRKAELVNEKQPFKKFERIPTPGIKPMIASFATWCKQNGIQLIATYPATITFPDYDREPYTSTFARIRALYDGLGINVVGEPKDFMYPKDMFFDMEYHLTEEAAAINSRKFAEMLRPALENGSK